MRVTGYVSCMLLLMIVTTTSIAQMLETGEKVGAAYQVKRLNKPLKIDAKWNKSQWRSAKALEVKSFIRENPEFKPDVKAKMMYDSDNLYVIFKVEDKYVRSITTQINGPVWKDSAVEFFFSPNIASASYFNLEVNCGGTPLLGYNTTPRAKPAVEDIKQIEIAHSMPEVVDPEIKSPVTWTVEYRIPLAMLRKYTSVTEPKKGVKWRANFYKIAENNSNAHHASWSPILHPKPTFHLPQYFGEIEFK
jgi:hypothetical protein